MPAPTPTELEALRRKGLDAMQSLKVALQGMQTRQQQLSTELGEVNQRVNVMNTEMMQMQSYLGGLNVALGRDPYDHNE